MDIRSVLFLNVLVFEKERWLRKRWFHEVRRSGLGVVLDALDQLPIGLLPQALNAFAEEWTWKARQVLQVTQMVG